MITVANIMEEGRFSGQHKRIISVAKRLKKYDIHTIVYFPERDSEYFESELLSKKVGYRKMKLNRPTKDRVLLLGYIFFFFSEIFSILKQLKKDQIDIVHCNGSWQIKGAIAAKLAKKKIVWHLNDTSRPLLIKKTFSLLSLFFADIFIVASDRVRDYYLQGKLLKKKRFRVIQAPVDTSWFNPMLIPQKGILAKYSGIKIISTSNVNPVKGIEYFVDMVNILNRKNQNLSFHIIGSIHENQEKYYNKIKGKIAHYNINNIYFHNFTVQVENYLKEADIFVCSSIFEASPTTVWEAMSMAKAIVSTDVGDVSKMITNDQSGFIVRTKDGYSLALKVQKLIDDPLLRNKFGQRARHCTINKLDIKFCVDGHRQVYMKAVETL